MNVVFWAMMSRVQIHGEGKAYRRKYRLHLPESPILFQNTPLDLSLSTKSCLWLIEKNSQPTMVASDPHCLHQQNNSIKRGFLETSVDAPMRIGDHRFDAERGTIRRSDTENEMA
jgi:hypothetical protein